MMEVQILYESTVFRNENPDHESIYAAFPQLCRLQSGELTCVFRIGSARYSYDGRFVLSRSYDNGRTWSTPATVIDPGKLDPPMLILMGGLCEAENALLIFGATLFDGDRPHIPVFSPQGLEELHARPYIVQSADGGKSWGKPGVLEMEGFESPGFASRPLRLSGGRILYPIEAKIARKDHQKVLCSILKVTGHHDTKPLHTAMVAMDPDGKKSYCDARIVELHDGTLLALLWTVDVEKGESDTVHATLSHDHGITWGKPFVTGMEGEVTVPAAGYDGTLIAASNHRRIPEGIRLYQSVDCGRTWDIEHPIQLFDSAACKISGEPILFHTERRPLTTGWDAIRRFQFGTPDIAVLPEGYFFMTYYATIEGVTQIRGVAFTLETLWPPDGNRRIK